MYEFTHTGQQRVWDLLKPKSQVTVKCPVWVLGTELLSSGKAIMLLPA